MTSQLLDLARPFPQSFIKENPSGGGVYVPHPLYTQRLLLYAGPYDFELVEIVRGDVAGKPPNPNGSSERAKAGTPDLTNVIVGAVMRLTVEVDGRRTVAEDVGDCEQPHNWPTDGARLKDAMSDALKRCCRHKGLGLHLYARTPAEYVLFKLLEAEESKADTHPPTGPGEQDLGDETPGEDDPGRPM